MDRRGIIMGVPMAGLAIDGTLPARGDDSTRAPEFGFPGRDTIEKVKLAMVAMQRTTRKEGVAMQAYRYCQIHTPTHVRKTP